MVYKMKNWFVYEPGDVILSLESGRKGKVIKFKDIDVADRTQSVDIAFKNGIQENVNTGNIELLRRAPFSALEAILKPSNKIVLP